METPKRSRWRFFLLLWFFLFVPLSATALLVVASSQPSEQESSGITFPKTSWSLRKPPIEEQRPNNYWDSLRTLRYDWEQWWYGEPSPKGDIQVILPELQVSPVPGSESPSSK